MTGFAIIIALFSYNYQFRLCIIETVKKLCHSWYGGKQINEIR